ncbi:MAG: hypothetical protein NTY47_08495 [Candidatus Omnitrophica bacterium]|nr:hypothetical protein [Candidatus Omnitrophota bacterium]
MNEKKTSSDWVETGKTNEAVFATLDSAREVVAKGKEWHCIRNSWSNRYYWNFYLGTEKFKIIDMDSKQEYGSIYLPEMLWEPGEKIVLKEIAQNSYSFEKKVDVSYDFHEEESEDVAIVILFDLASMEARWRTHPWFFMS